jgi:hypothetical protein
MHFSEGANWFYEDTRQLLDDLGEFKERHFPGNNTPAAVEEMG